MARGTRSVPSLRFRFVALNEMGRMMVVAAGIRK